MRKIAKITLFVSVALFLVPIVAMIFASATATAFLNEDEVLLLSLAFFFVTWLPLGLIIGVKWLLKSPYAILWFSITLIVLMILFPPFNNESRSKVVYAFLFLGGQDRNYYYYKIDLCRLGLQITMVGLVAGGMLISARKKPPTK